MKEEKIPLCQWQKIVSYDIYQFLSSYKNIAIHRHKMALLCNQLQLFRQSLNQTIWKNTLISRECEEKYHVIHQSLQNIYSLSNLLTEKNSLSFLINHPPRYVIEKISEFRHSFNSACKFLQLSSNEPCPTPFQQKNDDSADFREIRRLLEDYLKNASTLSDEIRSKISSCLSGFNEITIENGFQDDFSDLVILQESFVNETLKPYSNWSLNFKDIEMIRQIGAGGQATVYYGKVKNQDRFAAIKQSSPQMTKKSLTFFEREIRILSTFHHFAIVPFIGFTTSPPCILTQYMSGGDLFHRLHSSDLGPTKLTIIARGIACGMEYLHMHNLIHRDLKSLNVLLDDNDYPKISDFGLSRYFSLDDKVLTHGLGTPQWMAPEVLAHMPYGQKADVYSYAILLSEMITGEIPFTGVRECQIAVTVLDADSRPILSPNCPPELSNLIKRCWNREPQNRPSFSEIADLFDSGKILFPGCDLNEYQRYIDANQRAPYIGISNRILVHNIGLSNDFQDNQIISLSIPQHIDENNSSQISEFIQNSDWRILLRDTEFVSTFVNKMKILPIIDVISITEGIMKDDELEKQFYQQNGKDLFLELVSKANLISNNVSNDVLNKLSLILIHFNIDINSNLNLVSNLIKISDDSILSFCLEKVKAKEINITALETIIPSLSISITNKIILQIIDEMIDIPGASLIFFSNHFLERLLTAYPDSKNCITKLIHENPSDKFCTTYYQLLFKSIDKSNISIDARDLIIVFYTLSNDISYSFLNESSLITPIILLSYDDNVDSQSNNSQAILYSLKILYLYMKNSHYFEVDISSINEICFEAWIRFLKSENHSIKNMAALCLSVYISLENQQKITSMVEIIERNFSLIKNFINESEEIYAMSMIASLTYIHTDSIRSYLSTEGLARVQSESKKPKCHPITSSLLTYLNN